MDSDNITFSSFELGSHHHFIVVCIKLILGYVSTTGKVFELKEYSDSPKNVVYWGWLAVYTGNSICWLVACACERKLRFLIKEST